MGWMSISGAEANVFRSRFYQINSKFITTGVPQGYILGPILFLIYVDTKPENIRSLYFGDRRTIVVFQRLKPVEKTLNYSHNQNIVVLKVHPLKR